MARPKKAKELKRNHPIMLRLTNTEYEIVLGNARASSLPVAEYARKLVTGKQVKIKYEIVADAPELKKLIAEFGKIGSNLNQIARHFNSGGIHSHEMQKSIRQGIADIYEMKYEVLKMAGDFRSLSSERSAGQKGADAHGHPETHRH